MRFRIALVMVLASLVVPALASAQPYATHKAPIKVTVIAKEFSFSLTKMSVPHGSTVVFNVVNRGQLVHNFVFSSLGKKTPMLLPGGKATLTITFAKKGHYYYICSVPLHASQGMAGSFVVT
jgi:plastocyanin